MATIGGGSPKLYVEISASQVSGSGNSRTIRVVMKCRVNGNTSATYASWYGFPANYRVRGNGNGNWVYGSWKTLKGTETWKSSDSLRTFTQDITLDVGTTSSKSVSVGFDVDSFSGSSDWDGYSTISFTVNATNTAPTMSGSVTIKNTNSSGSVLTGIIPENVSTLYLSWPAGSDKEQSSGLKYGVSETVNGGGATTVVYSTTNLYTAINIGSGNEGQRRKYSVNCKDNTDAASGSIYSTEVTKNSFTPDTISSSSSIGFNTSSISFSFSGAKNTNENTSFTRTLSCNDITVYNATLSASPATVTIYRSGTTPTGCYIKFDDIKNKFKSSNYTGVLSFTLATRNAYGNSKNTSKSISVDLRANPNSVTGQVISTSASESTIYKKVASANNYYFIPDGNGVARVKWSAGSGSLGESISYEVYVAYDSGSWQKLADVPSNTLYYNHKIPKQTTSQDFKYLIRTKSSSGNYSDATTPVQKLHYYNSPSITVGQINRAETTATIPVTVSTSTSIPSVSTVGTWSGQGSGNLTSSQTSQNISLTGLTGNGVYSITVVYNDNTGFSSNQSRVIAVGANLPVVFINKYGLGVGGSKADSKHSLKIKGSGIGFESAAGNHTALIQTIPGDVNGQGMVIQSGGSMIVGSGESPNSLKDALGITGTLEQTYITSDNTVYFATACNTIADRKISCLNTAGNLHISGGIYENSNSATGGSNYSRVWSSSSLPAPAHIEKIGHSTYPCISPTKGSENGWVRTTVSGLLPNTSETSTLGTSSWKFKDAWIKQLNTDTLRISGSSYAGMLMDGTDTCIVNDGNNYLRLKKDQTMAFAGYPVYTSLGYGEIANVAARTSNLDNLKTKSGWYAWDGSTVGRPTSYGVCLNIVWNSTDTYQFAIGSNSACWTRVRVNNGAWSGWALK